LKWEVTKIFSPRISLRIEKPAAYKGIAKSRADMQILIVCDAISSSTVRTFIVHLLFLSSSIVFQWG